jgi:hypothetical protein
MKIVGAACCRKDYGELLRQRENYSDSIKPAAFGRPERAFSSLRRVPAATPAIGRFFHAWPHAAWYSAIACCPSRSCCSFFLKAASARSRARLTSVSNVVTPFRANSLAGQTFLPEDRMPAADVMLN